MFKVQLHNALIISLFDATATLKRPATPPPPTLPKPPPQKRRRTLLPYQGPGVPDDYRAIRSARMKRWALSMGKRERERLKNLQDPSAPLNPPRPRKETDEIANERGIELLPERGGPYLILCMPRRYLTLLQRPLVVAYPYICTQVRERRLCNMSRIA